MRRYYIQVMDKDGNILGYYKSLKEGSVKTESSMEDARAFTQESMMLKRLDFLAKYYGGELYFEAKRLDIDEQGMTHEVLFEEQPCL